MLLYTCEIEAKLLWIFPERLDTEQLRHHGEIKHKQTEDSNYGFERNLGFDPSFATNWLCPQSSSLTSLGLNCTKMRLNSESFKKIIIKCPWSSMMFQRFSQSIQWSFWVLVAIWDSEKLSNLLKATQQEFKPRPPNLRPGSESLLALRPPGWASIWKGAKRSPCPG